MSGSSSSGREFGGIMPQDTPPDCLQLILNTQVVSPAMEYFEKSSLGEILMVTIHDQSIVLSSKNGDKVGSILPPELSILMQCIDGGQEYNAKIQSISGAYITVNIQAI